MGALGIVGVPPFFGFVDRWRLYLTGVEYGGLGLGLAMAAATGLALFYYVRAIHRIWLGQPQEKIMDTTGEPKVAAILLVVLIVAGILLGLFPGFIFGQV